MWVDDLEMTWGVNGDPGYHTTVAKICRFVFVDGKTLTKLFDIIGLPTQFTQK